MAFKELSSSNRELELLWANEYLESNTTQLGTVHDVCDVYFSDKGYTITTAVCKAFLFKSSNTYGHIKQFVECWHSSKQPSPVLQVKLVKCKPHIVVGYDEERKSNWSINEKYYHQSYNSGSDNPNYNKPTNPLPLPPSPTSGVLTAQEENEPRDAASDKASKQHRLAAPGRALKLAESTNVSNAG